MGGGIKKFAPQAPKMGGGIKKMAKKGGALKISAPKAPEGEGQEKKIGFQKIYSPPSHTFMTSP